jgi:hypothetical protein
MTLKMLTLHRTAPLALTLTKPGETRAFAFAVELGLGKGAGRVADVDPESGMLVNLMQMDEILKELAMHWRTAKADSMLSLVDQSLAFVKTSLKKWSVETDSKSKHVVPSPRGLFLQRLCFYERRGEFFGWQNGFFCGRRDYRETAAGVQLLEAQFLGAESVPSLFLGSETDLANGEVFRNNLSLMSLRIEECGSGQQRFLQRS